MRKFKSFYIFKSSQRAIDRGLKVLVLGFLSLFMGAQIAQAEFGSIVDIGMAGDFYFSDGSANNGQVFANILIQNTWSDSQLWIDAGGGGLVGDAAHSYIKAPQLFYRVNKTNKTHLIIGRARSQWSYADSEWNMGLTQPLFTWDTARPEKQGLTGVFLKVPMANNSVQLTVFGSYLYLPSQGASYELTDGELISSNPWFNTPVQALAFSGEQINLNYDIDVPKAQDVVFRPSYGLQFSTTPGEDGFIFNSFYLNKPRNELVLPFEGALNLSTFRGDITILPQVAEHQVMGADIGWDYSWGQSVLSWVRESDIEYTIPGNTTYPIFSDQDMVSFSQLFRLSKTQRLSLSYINVDREETEIGGLFSSAQIDAYDLRNRFEEAARISWEGLLARFKSRNRVKARIAYTHNLKREGVWISADLRWAATRGLEIFSHCDFFGSPEEQLVGSDFISTFQNNDRCLVGGHYAF